MRGWYVLHVYSGYEKRVEEALNSLIEEKVLSDVLFQVKIPMREVAEIRNGKRRVQKKKIFPGYVLVEMDLDKRQWKDVYPVIKNINGVTGFVGASKTKLPLPLSPDEVKNLLQMTGEVKGEAVARTKYDFHHGETVKIIDGPFNSFTGTIEEINQEKNKLKVMVGIFGRATPVEVDFNQVEKI